ncbi:MAG: ABC transporter ATP-binding protein [Dehalococcoidia bacterium]
MTDLAIKIEGLGKAYKLHSSPLSSVRSLLPFGRPSEGDFWALRDVTYSIPKGRRIGIIGQNGAGKSTLLKILAGRLRPTTGKLEVHGRVDGILELGTGLQPQLTGRQNARLNALFMGVDPWKIEERLEGILEFSGIPPRFIDEQLDTYSSGMKARLAFSVLTALEPEILVLDEALATGDAKFAKRCTRFIRELCNSGATVIVVSHDLGFISEGTDEVLWIKDGQLVQVGRPAEVIDAYLASLGLASDFAERPRNILLRIEPEQPTGPVEYELQGVEFLDAEDKSLHMIRLGGELDAVHEAGLELGFHPRSLLQGFGEPSLVSQNAPPFRVIRPHLCEDRALYLPLPLPSAPEPLPVGLRLWGNHVLERPLVLSVLRNGKFQLLGSFGTPPPCHTHGTQAFPLDLAPAPEPSAAEASPA